MSARLLPLASLHDVTLLRSSGPRSTQRFTIWQFVTDPSADLGLTRGEWAGRLGRSPKPYGLLRTIPKGDVDDHDQNPRCLLIILPQRETISVLSQGSPWHPKPKQKAGTRQWPWHNSSSINISRQHAIRCGAEPNRNQSSVLPDGACHEPGRVTQA
ncbi:hypothetical protein VTN96DRAFT_6410 [Rasamsonia emersonii]